MIKRHEKTFSVFMLLMLLVSTFTTPLNVLAAEEIQDGEDVAEVELLDLDNEDVDALTEDNKDIDEKEDEETIKEENEEETKQEDKSPEKNKGDPEEVEKESNEEEKDEEEKEVTENKKEDTVTEEKEVSKDKKEETVKEETKEKENKDAKEEDKEENKEEEKESKNKEYAESDAVATYDIVEGVQTFSALRSASKDVSNGVKVNNLTAKPNEGSSNLWTTQFGKMSFDLTIPDNTQAGDTFSIDITGINSIQDFQNIKKIVNQDGLVLGEFTLKRGDKSATLTGTFNEEINNKINVKIHMDIGFKIDESYRGDDTPSNVTQVTNTIKVAAKNGGSDTFSFKSQLFNILQKVSIFNNIYGNENAAEIETIARISSNYGNVNAGTLTLKPVKGFSIPKDPKISLQGWVYTKQSNGSYKVETKKFEVEVIKSVKDELVIKTPRLVNNGNKIELLRVAVDGTVNNPKSIDYKQTSTDKIQVNGKFNSTSSGYNNLEYTGNSNLYYSDSIGAETEEIEGTIKVIKKDAETEELLSGAEFEVRDSDNKLVKKLTTNNKGEASIGKLPKGEYTVKETKAPKGYDLKGETKKINIEESKTYTYTVKNTFLPPTPKVEKDVEGKEHLDVDRLKNYDYNVKTNIPKDLNGYKDLTITDTLDNRLTIKNVEVLAGGKATDFKANVDGQKVTLKLDRKQLDTIAGKVLNVKITSQIKGNVDVVTIDNKADIQLNDNPKVDSNVVTVTPPEPETPDITKDVEGKEHLDVNRLTDYDYNVKTVIPKNLGGYKDITITDTLDNRLTVEGTKVLVDGKESDFKANVDGQKVTLKLDRKQLDTIKGKEVTVQITSQIKGNVDVVTIDNKASLQLNDNPEVDSNVVTVIPPEPVDPEITKDVEGKEHLEIEKGKDYNYNVKTNIPEHLGGYESITITDILDDRLSVQGTKVLVDGEETDFEVTVEGQKVTLELTREQLDTIAGQEVTLQITSKINEDVGYGLIENDATIQLNDNPEVESNVVTVIPPPTSPEIEKTVEGKDHIDVDYEKPFKYYVTSKLPNNIFNYEQYVIEDTVDKGLDVLGATVLVDGKEYKGVKVTIKGNKVVAEVTDFEGLKGKEQIELVIEAKVNEGTDISQYKDNKIPNSAIVKFINENGEYGEIESNVVTVTPPTPEDPVAPKIPQTGSGTSYVTLILGTLIVLLGAYVVIRRKESNLE